MSTPPEAVAVAHGRQGARGPTGRRRTHPGVAGWPRSLAPSEVEARFREPLEASGWRPGLLPMGWEKQIGGRTYQLSLGLSRPGVALVTMTSPGDMCQTGWL